MIVAILILVILILGSFAYFAANEAIKAGRANERLRLRLAGEKQARLLYQAKARNLQLLIRSYDLERDRYSRWGNMGARSWARRNRKRALVSWTVKP